MKLEYRWAVLVCENADTAPGVHDSGCKWHRVRAWWGRFDKSLYRDACAHPHAVVTGALMLGTEFHAGPFDRFEHVAGGGLCRFCRVGRGPMVSTLDGPAFACPDCCSSLRRGPVYGPGDLMPVYAVG